MVCLCTHSIESTVKGHRTEEKAKNSLLDAGRFYFSYLSVTGNFPLGGIWRSRGKSTFNWLSPKVAYTLGVLLFTILHGYNRVAESFKVLTLANGLLNTDQLVMASMTMTSPLVAIINMVGILIKAPHLHAYLEKWSEKKVSSSCVKQRSVILLFMAMFIGTTLYTLTNGFKNVKIITMRDFSIKVSDALFWSCSLPGITAPPCLYFFTTAFIATLFSELAQKCEEAAIISKATARNGEIPGNQSEELKVQHLTLHYNELKMILHEANKLLSPLLLLNLIYSGVELCMFLYEIMITILFQDENEGLGLEVIYATFFFILLLAVTEGAQAVEDQSGRCIDWMGEISGQAITQEERDCLSVFYPVALAKPIACHASNFFTINRRLLVAVLSATLTYIVILVQFKKSETVSKTMLTGR